jgi:hypothetical protein
LLNFQSARNATKIVSLCPSRLLIPTVYLLSQMRVRMEEISRYVRQDKQAKFLDADCTYPYSPYGDVAGPYRPYGDDVVVVYWMVAGKLGVDTCLVDNK